MENRIFVNQFNEHKYIGVRRYANGHYVVKQVMVWENGVVNYTGCSFKQALRKGVWHRISKKALDELLTDYTETTKSFGEVF